MRKVILLMGIIWFLNGIFCGYLICYKVMKRKLELAEKTNMVRQEQIEILRKSLSYKRTILK